jgi:hypothetical protein
MIPTCRTLILNLTEHEEDDGTWLKRAGVKLHLSLCGECYRFVSQSSLVRAALAGVPAKPISPDTKALLMDRFRAWSARHGGAGKARP